MYTDLFVLDGILETKEEINQAIREQTGDNDDFFDGEEWKGWTEYRDGKTIILADIAR